MIKKYLITTAIDYVNDVIHIGHAYQKILADSLARYHRELGEEVFFLTGTDEHGSKTEEAAAARGISPQEFADEISTKDQKQLTTLNISFNRFIRTTDSDHQTMVKDFYLRCQKAGDIYLGEYAGIYCVGCESFLKEKDLVNGKCPAHPKQKLQKVTEKNYFFRWSKYQDFLKKHLQTQPEFVQPEARRHEMLSFLDQGLEDLPISRASVKFGISVPNDPAQVLYVWFDALINYITGTPQYWTDEKTVTVHILGKDNVRWHALLWPAMLKSAGYRLPNVIYGHDFLTLNGQKISKSLGNIIHPDELVEQFGADAVRYFFLRFGPLRNDVDVTTERIKDVYNADLANGLGNLVARIAKLCEKSNLEFLPVKIEFNQLQSFYQKPMESFRIDDALVMIWGKISEADKFIDQNRVWEQMGKEQEQSLKRLVDGIREIAFLLQPFLPETAQKIKSQFQGPKIKAANPLFPRKSPIRADSGKFKQIC